MNRLERLSAILIRLQSRSVITAGEIAKQFGVSLRTVYRDIRALEESGVPVCGEAGTGYSLIDGYKLPPLMFTTEEALSFLLAEKLVANLTEGDTYGQFVSGMDKIKAVLRTSEKNIIEDFDAYIRVSSDDRACPNTQITILQPLLTALLQKRCIKIKYKAGYNYQVTERSIEPLGLIFKDTNWYILSWCRLRNSYRTFRLSRILQLDLQDCVFGQQHPHLDELIQHLYFSDPEYDICIRIRGHFLQFIGSSKYLQGLYYEEPDGEDYILKFRTMSLEYFCRWFLSFSDKAEIIEPSEIKEMVKGILQDIYQNNEII